MKALKKPLSLFLAFLMCFGVFAGTGVTAFAAGETMTTYMVDIPRASDPNKAGWGHSDMSFLGGWSAQANDSFSVHTQDAYNGKAIYCIEPGIGVKTGDQYTGRGEDFWDNYPSHLNPTIPPSTIKEYIGRIMTYGWQGNADTSWNSNNPDDANEMAGYIATQLLVWETVVGERDSQFNHVDANAQGKNNVAEYISSSHPLRSQIFSQYSAIESAVKRHTMLPSFFSGSPDAGAYELKWDGEKYSVIEMQNTPLTNQLLIEYAGKVRELQLSPEDAALLEQEHAKHPSSEALFIHPGTLKLHSPNMVRLRHNQILEKAEIPHIRFEDLRHIRHTCAILALQNVMTAAELTHLQGCCRPILTRQSYAEYMVQTQSAQKQKIASEQKHLQNEQQQATQAMDDLLGF